MMSVRVRDVSIPVSKVDLRPDPAGITRVSNLDPTTVTCNGVERPRPTDDWQPASRKGRVP